MTTYTPHVSTGSSYTSTAQGEGGSVSYAARGSYSAGGGVHAVYSIPAGIRSGAGNSTLPAAQSQSVLRQVNTARAGLTGVNKRPIPQGQVAAHPGGSLTVIAANGRKFDLRANGTLATISTPGASATFRGNGRLASVNTPSIHINRGPHGQRTIVTRRPDHSVLVTTGTRAGYLQRPVVVKGRSYVQRTYYSNGLRVSRLYSTYNYHGVVLDHYVPGFFYAPDFYGWAYYPWDTPAAYAWGWDGSPWFGYYSGYFSPWNAYQSGANWLADYYLGQTLFDGYLQQDPGEQAADDSAPQDDGSDAYAQADTPITPDIKQAIADEVRQQIAYENAASTQPDQAPTLTDLPQALTPNHIFVAAQPLNVITADAQSCALSAGNVLRLVSAPAEDSAEAGLTVVSSRRGDCPAGAQVTVSLQDLEEMQNYFRTQLDAGLQALRARQGQGGLPPAPYPAIAPPPRPSDEAPADNQNMQALLQAQQQQANQAEAGITQTAFASQQ